MIFETYYANPWTETLDRMDNRRYAALPRATDTMPACPSEGYETYIEDTISTNPYKDHKVPIFGLEAGRSNCHCDADIEIDRFEKGGWIVEKRLLGNYAAIMSRPRRFGRELTIIGLEFISITHYGIVLRGDRSKNISAHEDIF